MQKRFYVFLFLLGFVNSRYAWRVKYPQLPANVAKKLLPGQGLNTKPEHTDRTNGVIFPSLGRILSDGSYVQGHYVCFPLDGAIIIRIRVGLNLDIWHRISLDAFISLMNFCSNPIDVFLLLTCVGLSVFTRDVYPTPLCKLPIKVSRSFLSDAIPGL